MPALYARTGGGIMNAVKSTYIVCNAFLDVFLLSLAVAAPVWITPGYYWWTAFSILLVFAQGAAFRGRLNSWDGMGHLDD